METLQWHEPAFYRRAVARRRSRERPLEAIKVAVVAFLVLVALRGLTGLGRPNPNQIGWTATLILAAGIAIGLAFLPQVLLMLPNSIVILSPKGVNNNIIGIGASIQFWPWSEISSCGISSEVIDGKRVRTLTVYDLDDQEVATFGLRDKPTLSEIENLINRHGKPVTVDETPNQGDAT